MRGRKLLGGLLLGAFVAASAVFGVASLGRAGTNDVSFDVFAFPGKLTTGNEGLAIARFVNNSGGAATKTTITLTFPSAAQAPTVDPATSSDCSPASGNTITCAIGTVQPGQTIKRFVTYTAGSTLGPTAISATATWDGGSTGASGGGQTNSAASSSSFTIVDGLKADGGCHTAAATEQTAPVDSTVTQATSISFGSALASLQLPCTWGNAGVAPQISGVTSTQISYVAGPVFGQPATVTLFFASLPVPLSKFVLRENLSFDPDNPTLGTWTTVPSCPTSTTLPPGAPDCLVGFKNGKVITATLLYAGTNKDPGYAG